MAPAAANVGDAGRFWGTPWKPRRVAPDIGEHTVEVLKELGYDDGRIADLIESGAVTAWEH